MGFSNELSPTGFSNSADLEFLDIDGTGLNYDGQDTSSNAAASQSQYHNSLGSNSASSNGNNGSSNANSGNTTENDTSHNDDNGDNADLMTFVEAL